MSFIVSFILILLVHILFVVAGVLGRSLFLEQMTLSESWLQILHVMKIQKELDVLIIFSNLLVLSGLFLGKWRVVRYTFSTLLIFFLVFRAADYMNYIFDGQHLSADALDHITFRSVFSFASVWGVLASALLGLLVFWGASFSFHKLFRILSLNKFKMKVYLVLFSVVTTVASIKTFRVYTRTGEAHRAFNRFEFKERLSFISPEANLRNVLSEQYYKLYPEAGTIKALAQFGIDINLSHEKKFSFLKEKVFTEKVTSIDLKTKAPNIVLFVAESFSASFLDYFPEETRYIRQFQQQSLWFSNLYSTTFPTVNGMISTLCSYLPVMRYVDFIGIQNKGKMDLLCLPEVLKRYGYHNYYVTGEDVEFARKKEFFGFNGFENFKDYHSYSEYVSMKPLGSWGYSDDQLADLFIEDFKKNQFKEPFFVTIKTSDLHSPFKNAPGSTIVSENSLQNLIYDVDRSFHKIFKSLKGSNTIVVFIADHVAHFGKSHDYFLKGKPKGARYGKIPFIIYDPVAHMRGENKTLSSQVDVVPTLLHLLNINVKNSFEGLSIFEARKDYPHLLGAHYENLFYMLNDKAFNFQKSRSKDLIDSCLAEGPQGSTFDFCHYFVWMNYKYDALERNLFWKDDWLDQ